jgi:polyphosphate kinase 2 (PPK2 family)
MAHEGEKRRDKKGKKLKYEKELAKLQVELVKLQEWIKQKGLRVVAIFEGRDAAGKGGAIKRITECLNPRICRWWPWARRRTRKKTSGIFQRYVPHLRPRAKWCCSTAAGTTARRRTRDGLLHGCGVRGFLRSCPEFERMLVRSGIILIKYWFSVSTKSRKSGSGRGSTTRPSAGS